MVFCLDVDKADDGTTKRKSFPTFRKTQKVKPIPCISLLLREKKNVLFDFDWSLSLFCTESQNIG